MLSVRVFRNVTSSVLSLLLVIYTIPVQAAEVRAAVGSVSGVGEIQLRGMSVSQEGTVFAGDRVRTGSQSYAKLIFQNANRIELFNNADFVVQGSRTSTSVGLISGNLTFAASKSPISIDIAGYEVLSETGTTGGIAFVDDDYVGIHVMSGSATVRNKASNKKMSVSGGSVEVINLKTQEMNPPQLAAAIPAAPAAAPSSPSPSRSAAAQRTRGAGISPLFVVGVVLAAGAGLLVIKSITKNDSPSEP